MTHPKPENFVLSNEFLKAVDFEECMATFDAMAECEIDKAPYAELFITCPKASVMTVIDSEGKALAEQPGDDELFEFHYTRLAGQISKMGEGSADPPFNVEIKGWRGKRSIDYCQRIEECLTETPGDAVLLKYKDHLLWYSCKLICVLVVALATKGTSKLRERNKLASLGIGKGREARHGYTTTISVSRAKLSEEPSSGTGIARRPHLRRGHVRQQHWGPGNQLLKKTFIEAVFVNSDREFVSLRDHYNVSLTMSLKKELAA